MIEQIARCHRLHVVRCSFFWNYAFTAIMLCVFWLTTGILPHELLKSIGL